MVNGLTNELLFVMYKTPERGGRILSFNVVPDVPDILHLFQGKDCCQFILKQKAPSENQSKRKRPSYT